MGIYSQEFRENSGKIVRSRFPSLPISDLIQSDRRVESVESVSNWLN